MSDRNITELWLEKCKDDHLTKPERFCAGLSYTTGSQWDLMEDTIDGKSCHIISGNLNDINYLPSYNDATNCICGQTIEYVFPIQSKSTNKIANVGNDCIKKFDKAKAKENSKLMREYKSCGECKFIKIKRKAYHSDNLDTENIICDECYREKYYLTCTECKLENIVPPNNNTSMCIKCNIKVQEELEITQVGVTDCQSIYNPQDIWKNYIPMDFVFWLDL